MNTIKYLIKGGPNKDQVFDACNYAFDERVNLSLYFRVRKEEETGYPSDFNLDIISIHSIEHKDESGHNLKLWAEIKKPDGMPTMAKCDYDARERKGFIELQR